MLKWPDRPQVDAAVCAWAQRMAREHEELLRAGYFGSYARGDWGVGSDVDLVLVVERSALPFERRALEFDATALPVPAEVLVYTQDEWRRLMQESGRFARMLAEDTVWAYDRGSSDGRESAV